MPNYDTNLNHYPTTPEIVKIIQFKETVEAERTKRLKQLYKSTDIIDPLIAAHLNSIKQMEQSVENMDKAFQEANKAPAKPPKRHKVKRFVSTKKPSNSPAMYPVQKKIKGVETLTHKKKHEEKVKDLKKMPLKRARMQTKSGGPMKKKTTDKLDSKVKKKVPIKEPLVNKVKRQLSKLKISTTKKLDKVNSLSNVETLNVESPHKSLIEPSLWVKNTDSFQKTEEKNVEAGKVQPR